MASQVAEGRFGNTLARWLVCALASMAPAALRAAPPDTVPALDVVPALRRQEHGKTSRLAALAQDGHRIHAQRGLATHPDWLAIMDWQPVSGLDALRIDAPRWTSYEMDLARFPVPDGRHDPVVDFAASVALARDDWRWFSCRFPVRARFLHLKGIVVETPLSERCHALRRWLDPARVEGIDLVYVAQRWRDASASMGHVLLRVREGGGGGQGDRTVMWVALDPPETPGYLLKGVSGGLRGGPKFETWGEVLTRYRLTEGRDMHIYRLVLDDAEKAALLASIAVRRGGRSRIGYAFFTENCATMLWKILRGVVPELPEHASWMFHPHELPSELLRSGRAEYRETVRARRSLGIDGEAQRARVEEELREGGWLDVDTREALAAMDEGVEARAAALRGLTRTVASSPAAGQALWARWADYTIDIEAFALDATLGEIRPHATSVAFEEALSLRASIPLVSGPPQTPTPQGTIGPSGSRLGRVLIGALADRGRPGAPRAAVAWDVSVVDEEPGESRVAQFRRTSRIRLLANRLAWSSNGRDLAIEENRLVLFETAERGRGFETEEGALGARLGSSFAVVTESRPRLGLPFAALVRWGPGLLVAGDPSTFDYLTLTAELEAAAYLGARYAEARVRGVARLGFEVAVQLGAPEHRWRSQASAGLFAQPGGFGAEWRAETRIDLTLDRRSGLGLHLAARWAMGDVAGDGWQALFGVFY